MISSALGVLLVLGAGAAWTLALGSWLAAVVYGIKAIRRPRAGILLWGRATMWNPANALLRPQLLTEDGQRYRTRCFRAVLIFVACVSSGLVIGAVSSGLK